MDLSKAIQWKGLDLKGQVQDSNYPPISPRENQASGKEQDECDYTGERDELQERCSQVLEKLQSTDLITRILFASLLEHSSASGREAWARHSWMETWSPPSNSLCILSNLGGSCWRSQCSDSPDSGAPIACPVPRRPPQFSIPKSTPELPGWGNACLSSNAKSPVLSQERAQDWCATARQRGYPTVRNCGS